jgi:hypothetical protein
MVLRFRLLPLALLAVLALGPGRGKRFGFAVRPMNGL